MYGILEALDNILREPFLYGVANLLELTDLDDLWISDNLGEPAVPLALLLPDLGPGPLIDEREHLEEEDAEVVGLDGRAAVDRRHDRLEELGERVQDVEVGHAVVVQGAEEVEREQAVLGRKHHARVDAVLDEHCAQID